MKKSPTTYQYPGQTQTQVMPNDQVYIWQGSGVPGFDAGLTGKIDEVVDNDHVKFKPADSRQARTIPLAAVKFVRRG